MLMSAQASGVRTRQPGMMEKLEDGVKAQAKKLLLAERQARAQALVVAAPGGGGEGSTQQQPQRLKGGQQANL